MDRKIKVLVVDDSSVVRKMICDALANDPAIHVVGTAPDPYVARDQILALNPDVLTLDIEMPRMDGLTFLKILQQHKPIPVIIISSLTQAGSKAAIEALALGAMEVLAKPTSPHSIGQLGGLLAASIKGVAGATVRLRPAALPAAVQRIQAPTGRLWQPRQLITIGASTGGVEALTEVLTQLPGDLPGIAIVQHIPAYFSKVLAERLSAQCAFAVREAVEGELLTPGLALIAPGDHHLRLNWAGAGYRVSLNQTPPVHHCRPAVDVLFRSAAECPGARIVSVLLTGMGCDGALGMKCQRAAGAKTIAQDQATSVVFGMPRAAVELGVVDQVLPLPKIAAAIVAAAQVQAGGAPSHREPVLT